MDDLNQKEFSDFIQKGLLQKFPQFTNFLKLDNDIITIEYPSPSGLVNFWITTQDLEITIGVDDKDGNCSWHAHMSQYSVYEPADELKVLLDIIARIFSETEFFVIEDNVVIYITQNPEEVIEENITNRILDFKKWSEI